MRTLVISLIALVAVVVACTTPVYAQGVPQLPHAFYGKVFINGVQARDNTLVSATTKAGTVMTNSQNPVATKNGSYGINSLPLLVQGDIANGTAITFHVTNQNGTAVASVTAVFESGGGPTSRDLSVTIASPPSGGGGGGGGGPLPIVTPTPSPGPISLIGMVDSSGTFTRSVSVPSADAVTSVTIDADTKGKTASGAPLTQITVAKILNAQAPPVFTSAITATYDFGPNGATFDKPVTISTKYDPARLPPRANESNLYFAWWDTTASQWVKLASSVDKNNKIVTANVNHFTEFGLLVSTRPATFIISDLTTTPDEVEAGGAVTIKARIVNDGDLEGTWTVTLKVNGSMVTANDVTLAGQASQIVTFAVSRDVAGTYSVDVNGSTGSFTVKSIPILPTPAPTTAQTPVPAPVYTQAPVPIQVQTSVSTKISAPSSAPTTPTTNWLLMLGIAGGVIIVGVLLFLIRRTVWLRKKM